MLAKLIEPKNFIIEEQQKIFTNEQLKMLIIPILIEQFLMLVVGLVDTLMVSYAGEAAVSGVALVNQINAVFLSVFAALAAGGAVVISQYIGRQEKRNAVLSASQLIMLSLAISFGVAIIILAFDEPILRVLFGRVEADVMSACVIYLFITTLSLPAIAVYNACSSILRSMSDTKTTMRVSVIMNILNVVGNYLGIFVFHAGVAGVAIPSLVSRVIATTIMLYVCSKKDRVVFYQFSDIFKYDPAMVKRIVHIAVPNGLEQGLLNLSKVALSSIVAMFGTVQIAANGIGQSFWSVSALFSLSMGPAFITVIGQCIGGGDYQAANYYFKKLSRIAYVGCFIWNAIFTAMIPFILTFYSLSPETTRLVIILCLIHNFFNFLMHPSAFALSSGLRAAGDVKYAMYVSIFATFVVRVVFSIILGIWLQWGVIGVTFAMCFDWIFRAVFIELRYRSGKWKNFNVI